MLRRFQIKLNKKAVKTPGWSWSVGMLDYHSGIRYGRPHFAAHKYIEIPKLDDPATGGLLLSLLDGPLWVQRSERGEWMLMAPRCTVGGACLGEVCVRYAVERGYWRKDE